MNEVFSSIAPDELKCEYKTKPLGIDVKTPRLSWITKSPRFNSSQSAYQIQVASNKNLFENNICDIWDSGKIKSSSSNQIPFCGNNLESNKTYFWRVKIWNELNEESSWSEVTFFSTGLFEQNDWKAKWISHQYSFAEKSQLKFLQGIDKWIWYPFTNPDDKYKTICLFKSFQVSNASEIQSANLLVTADEKFQLFINEKLVAKSDDKIFSWARPSSVSVKNFLRTGPN
ncbi:MAG: hypothetical protein HXY50_07390, partial [Ignavibacteriaceae bacterium]|nr:hypothetical protein [Ignavibacteriaceae bacterium]